MPTPPLTSRLSTALIERIASSLQLDQKMGAEAMQGLATEVEVRLRLIVQDAMKFAEHANRTSITPADVNQAVDLRGDQRLLGFASERQMHFASQFHRGARAAAGTAASAAGCGGGGARAGGGGADKFFFRDETLNLERATKEARQTKRPCAPEMLCHFLAIRGAQPAVVENPAQHPSAAIAPYVTPVTISSTTPARKQQSVRLDQIVEHELSSEQISYYKTIVKDVLSSTRSALRMVYASLSRDFGLQNLLPYFVRFMFDQQLHILKVEPRPLWALPRLRALLCVVQCLLSNPTIEVEAYLHRLNPFILTVLVNRLLTSSVAEDHWALRDYAADLAAKICDVYDEQYPDMRTKIVKTLFEFLRDPQAPYTSQYGAIAGLAALGPNVVEQALLPVAPAFLRKVSRLLRKFGRQQQQQATAAVGVHPDKKKKKTKKKKAKKGTAPNPMQAVEAQRCAWRVRVALGTLLCDALRQQHAGTAAAAAAAAAAATGVGGGAAAGGGGTPVAVGLLKAVTSSAGLPFVTAGNLLTASDCRAIGGAFARRPVPPPLPTTRTTKTNKAVAKAEAKAEAKAAAGAQARRSRKLATDLAADARPVNPLPPRPPEITVGGGSAADALLTKVATRAARTPPAEASPSRVETELAGFFQTCMWVLLSRLYVIADDGGQQGAPAQRGGGRGSPRRRRRHRQQFEARFADNVVSQLVAHVRRSPHPDTGATVSEDLLVQIQRLHSLLAAACGDATPVDGDGHAAVLAKWAADGVVADATAVPEAERLALRKILAVSGSATAAVRAHIPVVPAPLLLPAGAASVKADEEQAAAAIEDVLADLAHRVVSQARAAAAATVAAETQRRQRRAAASAGAGAAGKQLSAGGVFRYPFPSRFADPDPPAGWSDPRFAKAKAASTRGKRRQPSSVPATGGALPARARRANE